MHVPRPSLPAAGPRPATWVFVLAFAVLYAGYGFNFLAVRLGVEAFPPFVFAGAHVFLAGVFFLVVQLALRKPVLLPWSGVARAALASVFLFVGGVGGVTLSESLGVHSGVAAVIKASAPLWVATIETLRPHGERATPRMFTGLAIGAVGVVVMAVPQIGSGSATPAGILILIASALLFAIGTIIVRHYPPGDSVLTGVTYQMILGGTWLLALGALLGEPAKLHLAAFTGRAVGAFLFLLVVHSLGAFFALNWLLRWFPAPIVTTKFYVSPAIAVIAGWLVLGEEISLEKLASLVLILGGVAILLTRRLPNPPLRAKDRDELEE